MDNKILARQVFELISPVIEAGLVNKPVSEISRTAGIHTAEVWQAIGTFIINEAKELMMDINDEDLQGAIRSKIRRLLEQDEAFKSAVEALIRKENDENSERHKGPEGSKNTINNSTITVGANFHQGDRTIMTHHGSGDIVGGDKIVNH